MVIHVALGDLTQLPVDAIVVPTNSACIMATGLGLAVKEAGGESIEQEAQASAPVAVGAALVTAPGELFCKAVIHVPLVEELGMKVSVENIRRATRAGLLAAARSDHAMVGIAAMGTGLNGVPVDEATRAMVDELRAHRLPLPSTVYLVGSSPEVLQYFEEALRLAALP